MLKLERILGLVVCAFAISLSFRITYTWIVLIAGLIIWVVWKVGCIRTNTSGKHSLLVFGPLALPLAAYALAVTLSGIGRTSSAYGHISVKEVLASVSTLRAFIVYFWAFDIFKNCPKLRIPTIACMLVTASASGVVAAIQQLLNWHPWSAHYLQGTGFFSEPMAFAGVMQVFSIVAVGIFLTGGYGRFPRPFNLRVVWLMVALTNCAGLVFASERGAWLGFAVAVLTMTAFVSLRALALCVTAFFCSGAFAWFFVPVISKRLMPLLTGQNDHGVTSRLGIWRRAYDEFLTSPITGIGTTRFPHIEVEGATELGKPYLTHAHSNILQVLSTAGIIGLCSYLWIIVATAIIALSHYFRNTPTATTWLNFKQRYERGVALGLFGALLSLTIAGLTEYNFGTGQVRLALWFSLALLCTDI